MIIMEKLESLYTELCDWLVDAPTEDCCTDTENEVYADMANLKGSIETLMMEKKG